MIMLTGGRGGGAVVGVTVRKIRNGKWNFSFAYMWCCLQETLGECKKLHPARLSCLGKPKSHTKGHTSNIY